MKPALLVVDDDEDIRTQMKWALAEDYEVSLAESRSDALLLARQLNPRVVLLDLGLPPRPADTTEGFLALGELLGICPEAKIVVITGQSEKEHALTAIGQGAYDFFNKPVDVEELRLVLRRAFYLAHLEVEYRALQAGRNAASFEGMLGESPQIQNVFTAVRKVAPVSASVLLLGESGTGKEMTAMAIHRLSTRKDGPFVAINCQAIPETLLESELFGHEKGAFTGAHTQRRGLIETASGGTLFLDEIGELPAPLQVKLLRFLQNQTIERVGGRTTIQVDTRIVAATNADLKKELSEGRFREDLYFRIAVVTIRIPPLCEREGDIPLLAKLFLRKYAQEAGKEIEFSAKALKVLMTYEWPGNVRELENRVRRAVIMADHRLIKPADLELEGPMEPAAGVTLKEAREQVERELVQRAMARHKGNISKTSESLGISRPTLYELMEKLGIQRDA